MTIGKVRPNPRMPSSASPEILDPQKRAHEKTRPSTLAVLLCHPGFRERAGLDILHHHDSFDVKGYPADFCKARKFPGSPHGSSASSMLSNAWFLLVPYRKGPLRNQETVRRPHEASGTAVFDPVVVQVPFLSVAGNQKCPQSSPAAATSGFIAL